MIFEYQIRSVANDTIDIDDIGNVCLEAYNDDGQLYYLMISTDLGFTTVTQVGAIIADTDDIDSYFDFNRKSFEYNETKLTGIINKFLSDGKHLITQVFFSNEQDIKDKLKKLNGVQIIL